MSTNNTKELHNFLAQALTSMPHRCLSVAIVIFITQVYVLKSFKKFYNKKRIKRIRIE